MYRGSAFIMQNRVSIFQEVIDGLLRNLSSEDIKYLYSESNTCINQSLLNTIASVINDALKKYATESDNERNSDHVISHRLITKIILGIFCLTPAFDTEVEASIVEIKKELGKHSKQTNISRINLLLYISNLCLNDHDLRSQLKKICLSFDPQSEERYLLIRTLDLVLWKNP